MSFLSLNTQLFEPLSLQGIINTVEVGDFLCVLKELQYEHQPDGTLKDSQTWYLYPITGKSHKALHTKSLRWNNLISHNLLKTSSGGHGASCYLRGNLFPEILNHPNTSMTNKRTYTVVSTVSYYRLPGPAYTKE